MIISLHSGVRPGILRHAGRRCRGGAEGGYTLQEAAALARSSVPAQRAAACRLLGAVLARARPTPADALRSVLGPPGCHRVLEVPPGVDPAEARIPPSARVDAYTRIGAAAL